MAAATAAPGRDREISGEPDLEDMAPRILVFSLAETPIECRTPVTQISRWIHPARVAARGTSAAPPGLAWPRASGRQRAWEAGHEVEDTDPGRTKRRSEPSADRAAVRPTPPPAHHPGTGARRPRTPGPIRRASRPGPDRGGEHMVITSPSKWNQIGTTRGMPSAQV